MSKMDINVRAWMTPNFIQLAVPQKPGLRQDGFKPQVLPTIPFDEVDVEVLDKMCTEFRADVFRKAGKEDPYRVLHEDIIAAAGELPIPVPEPGSIMSKLLIANILLKRKVAGLDRP